MTGDPPVARGVARADRLLEEWTLGRVAASLVRHGASPIHRVARV